MHPGALDGATGDEATAISQQHNLEHHPWVVGVGSGFIVAKTRIELAQIEFVVHQMIERELEGTGLDLLTQHDGQKAWAAVDGFVAGHGIGASGRCMENVWMRCGDDPAEGCVEAFCTAST